MRIQLVALAVVLGASGTAAAYPQFQLSRDQTCSGCHLSPAGGGLLNENGLNTAESISQYGTAPEFFYKKVPLPDWLAVGGDLRGATGFIRTPDNAFAYFPMQGDVYANATFGHISAQVTVGGRPTQWNNEGATHVWSREHYLQYQQNVGGTDGLYVRVGRFMPVIGLRFAEHVDFNRKFGGAPLYGETYGAAVEYIKPEYEVHVSGFIKDPVIDPVLHDNGAALYSEYRVNKASAVGFEAMVSVSDDDKKYRAGVTAKHYFEGQDALVQFEGQFVNQRITDPGGGATWASATSTRTSASRASTATRWT